MLLSRRIDDKEIQLKNQSQIFFQISGAGHEAILVAAGHGAAGRATTGSIPTTATARCACALGMTPLRDAARGASAPRTIPNSGGRQMPSHWGHKALNIVSQSSPTGTQCLQAVGCAEAGVLYERLTAIADRDERFQHDEVVVLSRSATARRAKASSGSR